MINPFQFDRPTSPDNFLGRRSLVLSMMAGLERLNGHSYAVIGGRRIGKTSLLKALEHEASTRFLVPNHTTLALLPVYLSLQGTAQPRNSADVFGSIIHRIHEITAGKPFRRLKLSTGQLDLGFPPYEQKTAAPGSLAELEETINQVCEACKKTFGKTIGIVLLLDEADVATNLIDRDTLFGNLRSLVDSGDVGGWSRLVLAGSESLIALKHTGSPLLNILNICFLQAFDTMGIQELLARAEGLLSETASSVCHLAGGHPFILQYLLYHLSDPDFSSATTDRLQAVTRQFVIERHKDMEGWWQSVGEGAQKVYACLCNRTDWTTDEELIALTQEPETTDWLNMLSCHGIVVQDGTYTRYRIEGALFRDWVTSRHLSRQQEVISDKQPDENSESGFERLQPLTGDKMDLTLEQRREFRDAFIAAFPNTDAFEALLYYGVGTPLNHLVTSNVIPDIVLRLLVWAESQGKMVDLIVAARNANPGNPKLRRFAENYLRVWPSQTQQQFEKTILGSVLYANPDDWRTRMNLSELTVCRVEYPVGQGQGTGFLLGSDVVMTNYHVIEPLLGDSALRQQTVLRFDYKIVGADSVPQSGQVYQLASDWLVESSPISELDFALLRVDGTPGSDSVGQQEAAPSRGFLAPKPHKFEAGEPILIFGHPQLDLKTGNTEPMKYTLGSLTALPDAAHRIQYNTNTEPGSSGSPCFNANWDLVALHAQAGNRGITFSAILDYLAQHNRLDLLGQ